MAGKPDPPALVVTVVVDGLGTRQLLRHEAVLDAGGFRRMFDEGAFFDRARYAHSTTFTGPGHGTIATGSNPREHGLVGNAWFDRAARRRVYCVEDASCRTLGGRSERRGVSGRNLAAATLADVLYERSSGRSRTLAVSLKDRGAVTGAGGHGTAFWFDNDSGRFQTSGFYSESLPIWWKNFFASSPQDRFVGGPRFDAVHPQPWHRDYRAALPRLRADGVRIQDFQEFPSQKDAVYYRALKSSPRGDVLTYEFVREALLHSDLGRVEGRLDQLFVSFSAHDYVAHDVGPDSPQASGVVENLDHLLAEFFALLDTRIGPDRWVLAFTADHGYPDTPEVVAARGEDAGRLDPRRIGRDLDDHLDETFGPSNWVLQWATPTFYLASVPTVSDTLVWHEAERWLEQQRGIREVYRRDELERDTPTDDELLAAARASYFPGRSGDLLILQDPNWYLLYDPRADVCTHGSPWDDDREVPLIFVGRGVRPGRFHDEAHVRDLAPTLLALVGQKPAASMTGKVLQAALQEPPSP